MHREPVEAKNLRRPILRKPEAEKPRLFPSSAIFGDIHDLVLKNKKIGSAFARQPHHVLVVILDPAADSLTIHKLHANRLLLLAQSLKEAGFFEGLFRRRGPTALSGVRVSLRAERHRKIVHGGR